jgi:hypothetical protein
MTRVHDAARLVVDISNHGGPAASADADADDARTHRVEAARSPATVMSLPVRTSSNATRLSPTRPASWCWIADSLPADAALSRFPSRSSRGRTYGTRVRRRRSDILAWSERSAALFSTTRPRYAFDV